LKWVGDSHNNRVLEFEPPFSTGMSASLVIGQQDFTTNAPSTKQNGLGNPFHLCFDSSGNLWVSGHGNNRILESTSTAVPEFPTASLAITAVASLAVVAVVTQVPHKTGGALKRKHGIAPYATKSHFGAQYGTDHTACPSK
jgi:hypothetical protein